MEETKEIGLEELASNVERQLSELDDTGVIGPVTLVKDIFSLGGYCNYRLVGSLYLPLSLRATRKFYREVPKGIVDLYCLTVFHPDFLAGGVMDEGYSWKFEISRNGILAWEVDPEDYIQILYQIQ